MNTPSLNTFPIGFLFAPKIKNIFTFELEKIDKDEGDTI